ncbi:MAG TPA: hypothetical protein VIW29_21295, partial [Polyangiaceae bacterium]
VVAIDSMFRAGIQVFDVQFVTEHLLSLGAYEVSRDDYLEHVHRYAQRAVSAESIQAALDGWQARF